MMQRKADQTKQELSILKSKPLAWLTQLKLEPSECAQDQEPTGKGESHASSDLEVKPTILRPRDIKALVKAEESENDGTKQNAGTVKKPRA